MTLTAHLSIGIETRLGRAAFYWITIQGLSIPFSWEVEVWLKKYLIRRHRFEPRPSTNSAGGPPGAGRRSGSPSETKVRKAGYEPASMKSRIPPQANWSEIFFEQNRKQMRFFSKRIKNRLLSENCFEAYLHFNSWFRCNNSCPCCRRWLTQLVDFNFFCHRRQLDCSLQRHSEGHSYLPRKSDCLKRKFDKPKGTEPCNNLGH